MRKRKNKHCTNSTTVATKLHLPPHTHIFLDVLILAVSPTFLLTWKLITEEWRCKIDSIERSRKSMVFTSIYWKSDIFRMEKRIHFKGLLLEKFLFKNSQRCEDWIDNYDWKKNNEAVHDARTKWWCEKFIKSSPAYVLLLEAIKEILSLRSRYINLCITST